MTNLPDVYKVLAVGDVHVSRYLVDSGGLSITLTTNTLDFEVRTPDTEAIIKQLREGADMIVVGDYRYFINSADLIVGLHAGERELDLDFLRLNSF